MATESQSAHGVRTYRGRTLEELLPQIREELGPDAIILREREGLVGGVGGFFAQRFIEVDARRGEGQSIDIYDEDDDELPLSVAGGLTPSTVDELGEPARPQLPPAPQMSEPRPFVPIELHREPSPAPEAELEPAPPTRRFETDIFLERLRAASQVLPDEDEELDEPSAAAPVAPPVAQRVEPELEVEPRVEPLGEPEAEPFSEPEGSVEEEAPPRPPRRSPQQRKPRASQSRGPKPQPRAKPAAKRARPAAPKPEPIAEPVAEPALDETAPQASPQARPEPTPQATPEPTPEPRLETTPNPYDALRQRPPSLRTGLPTTPRVTPTPPAPAPAPTVTPSAVPPPSATPARIAPLEIRGYRQGGLRGVISRLLGGRFGGSTMPKPSPPRPIDGAAASAIASELSARGASHAWTAQLIGTAAAHGTPLTEGSLQAAAAAELARRIVPAPTLPPTGAAVAFIGAGGTGKTRCTAALASAYSRASTLGVTVIAIDNPGGARELEHLLHGDGVPVLSLSGERAQRAIAAARESGFVIVDTPTATPTDVAAVEALGTTLEQLGLDATFVTLPATLGPQAARRALASFGRLNPSAVAITHADETDQLAVVVEIAIAHRIPLAYLHGGTDHRTALSAVEASTLAQRLLAS